MCDDDSLSDGDVFEWWWSFGWWWSLSDDVFIDNDIYNDDNILRQTDWNYSIYKKYIIRIDILA